MTPAFSFERSLMYKSLIHCLLLAICLILCVPGCKTRIGTNPNADVANEVRTEFLHAWNSYKKYAWRHDELKPLTKSYRDWHAASLYMTPVDALDTMYLMGMKEEADQTKEFIVRNLVFDHDIYVKNFEITIRILGGLLSSFQITGDQRLLRLAEDLGLRLVHVFDSPTGMPYMFINLKTGDVRGAETNPAEIGTLLIEFGALSKLTGNPRFYRKAKNAVIELFKRRSAIGLVGSKINVETGEWLDRNSHISGGIDSYYEYLLKSWKLFDDEDCHLMWKQSVQAVNQYLADQRRSGLWYGYVDMDSGARVGTRFGSLDAFFPGVLALSGDLDRAKALQKSSYKMWLHFGIEPEEMDYTTMKVTYDGYALRPEIIESAYYLFYFTKDLRYVEMGKKFFQDLRKYCRTGGGYAALKSVQTKEKKDRMESYFLAETLKYLYLLFSLPETIDLSKTVFNTEAHPIKKTW